MNTGHEPPDETQSFGEADDSDGREDGEHRHDPDAPLPTDAKPSERHSINLDDLRRTRRPTGDPMLDKGMAMPIVELEKALADPEHPDHQAAKAANRHVAERMSQAISSGFGDQIHRINENLLAAIRPHLSSLAPLTTNPITPTSRPKTSLESIAESAHSGELDYEHMLDATPARTYEALLDVSERMSEMVRVAAEHRDLAVSEYDRAVKDREAAATREQESLNLARKSVKVARWATWGTWVAVATAAVFGVIAMITGGG